MQVDGPGSVKGPKQAKDVKKTRKGGAGFASALDSATRDGAGDAGAAAAAGGLAGVAGIDALIALQAADAPEAGGGDARARREGEDILDRLDDLRLMILSGGLDPDRLDGLAEAVRDRAAGARDPRLREILADIELRARVELAKHGPR